MGKMDLGKILEQLFARELLEKSMGFDGMNIIASNIVPPDTTYIFGDNVVVAKDEDKDVDPYRNVPGYGDF